MNTVPRRLLGLVLAGVGLSVGLGLRHGLGPDRTPTPNDPPRPRDAPTMAVPTTDLMPAAFVANEGQWDSPARFVLSRRGLVVEVRPGGLVCRTRTAESQLALTLEFEAAQAGAIEGIDQQPGERHFFVGNDPARWRSHVRAFAQVMWRGLYPGVDVRLATTNEGLRYDLLLTPEADLSRIRVRCAGQTSLHLEPDGALSLGTAQGAIRQSPPVAWHELPDGQRLAAPCRFVRVDHARFGFELEGPRLDLPLVVDPGLDFYAFLGGSFLELLNAVVEAPDGTLVVVGQTQSVDFPATNGAAQTASRGFEDGFIARMDARARTLLYATYLGGTGTDNAKALALNAAGEAFVTGESLSTDFPVTPGAFQTQRVAWSRAFVTRLSQDGSRLIYSTYLGGSYLNTRGHSIAVGQGDEAFVTGLTYSWDFPVTPGAFRTTYGGVGEAFVSRLDARGSRLVASTFFGGNTSGEEGLFVSVDSTGDVTLAGQTLSSDLPVTPNAFQSILRGSGWSAFFAILDPSLTGLLYSTYYGGSAGEYYFHFAQNHDGHLAIMGATSSADLPGARGSLQGAGDTFVAVFDPVQLVAARYLSTADNAGPYGVHIDPSGVVTLSGVDAPSFQTTAGAWQVVPRNPRGGGFVARMGPDLDLWYASYSAGSVADAPDTISRTRDGWTLLGGRGASPEMPTPGVFNSTLRGVNDGFVARMDLLPIGVQRYGVSSGACRGPIVMDVTRMPAGGTQDFTVVCSAAPPSTAGWLVLGVAPDAAGTPVLGANLHVSVNNFILALPLTSSATGFGSVRLPLYRTWRGTSLFAQFVWVNPPNCTGNGPLSSSNALQIVVQ